MPEQRPEVARSWCHDRGEHEEYIVKVLTPPGVNATLEEAIVTAAQYVHDIALAQGVECQIIAGRADQAVSYVPSPSMYGHFKLAELDTAPTVRFYQGDGETIYVKD